MGTQEVLWFSENFLMILGIKLESLALLLVNLMRKSLEFTQKLNHFYHGLRANWNRDFFFFLQFFPYFDYLHDLILHTNNKILSKFISCTKPEYTLNPITTNPNQLTIFITANPKEYRRTYSMAQPADGLKLEEAHWRVMSKITEVEKFLQQHTYPNADGNLRPEQWAEAEDLQQIRRSIDERTPS